MPWKVDGVRSLWRSLINRTRRGDKRSAMHTMERLRTVQYFGDQTGHGEPGVQEEDRTRPWVAVGSNSVPGVARLGC
jgi:hypothetical protein